MPPLKIASFAPVRRRQARVGIAYPVRVPGWALSCTLSWALLTGLFYLAALTATMAHAAAPADPVIAQAHAAWRAKDANRLAQIAQRNRNHTLAPYFDYWQVMLAPEEATIRPFLERYPGTALAEQLRADWIRGLGPLEDWKLIANIADQLDARENDIGCWTLRARWETGDKRAVDELRAKWLIPSDFYEPCVPVAEALVKSGQISESDVWLRARRLVEAGQYGSARRTLRWLPANRAPSNPQLDNAIGRPEFMLKRGLYDARQSSGREMVAFAIVRIANDDPERALQYLQSAAGALSEEQRGWAYGQLGLVAARKLQPRALEWFRASRQAQLSDEHYRWWTRIAAREGAWSDIGFAVGHMSDAERDSAPWQYWLGRSFAARGESAAAGKAVDRAAAASGFYAVLAGEALSGRPLALPVATPPPAADLAEMARDPAIQRTVALLRADLRLEGLREWEWAVRKAEDRRLHAAARYFDAAGIWDRAVDTAERTARVFDLDTRYPFAHAQVMNSNAAAAKIDPALVFSIARQESRFNKSARSWVGATGLMQVMPATGAAVAKSIGLSGQTARLSEADYNVRIGAQYLKSLVDDLGSPMLAFAAYNAGPGRALGWRGTKPMDAAAYAESIPFYETRDYVKRVAADAYYYQMRITGKTSSLKQFIGEVSATPPAETVAAAPLTRVNVPDRR
jgi:soluble lytic murein transglycosylase